MIKKHVRRKRPRKPEPVIKLRYEDYYMETRDRYVKGLLMMITYQCEALVEKFKVTPLIIGLVGPICLRFVSLSEVFDDDWADKAIRDSELLQSKVVKRRRKGVKAEEEPHNLHGKRAVTIWVSLLKKSLPLSSSLAISFLACHKARSPVLPTDIARWARQGDVPYFSSFLKIRELMGERSPACPVSATVMFRPIQIVSAQRLEAQAASIADFIGLPLPPVNFYGIASNYLRRLFPTKEKEKAALLDRVCLLQNWSMPSGLYLSKNELRFPTRVRVMSIIIVAIRMLYNVNGFGVWERSLLGGLLDDASSSSRSEVDAELSKPTEEFDTVELLKNLETEYYKEVAAETVNEYEKDLTSYLLHGRNEMFAGLVEASADDTYRTVDHLWNSYHPIDEESELSRIPSKRGRDWDEDDLLLNQLSLNDDKLRDRDNNFCSSRRSRKSDCDEPPSPDNHINHDKEKAIIRLITDMGDNLFSYIPPRVKVKRLDYLQYLRKKNDGALIYAAHADYYILLRVCAIVAEIDPRNLHTSVLSFERRLAWVEKYSIMHVVMMVFVSYRESVMDILRKLFTVTRTLSR
ncbi:PREDICTED: TATA box-binding protein-associated factor RNA polymerase I subunit B-like [Camelina sativa]|uniref:TATA box-binding protein-associated factor RNA polymerase I subunit B-like n=1 Tax=Camelina sativa TaxID=90675 RepID=A0ABM0THN8_CAMSA|nr:PREDICTED: TATA box-binding protein-associated factor RNA polymerase I subunit B-like [Camelina sativa]